MKATESLDRTVEAAVRQGLLPPGTTAPAQDSRPWPVVLLIALGAWLAALPLLGVAGLLLGGIIAKSIGAYFVGALLLAAAVVVLRSRDLPAFVEQLAIPALLVGGGTLGFGLFRDLPAQGALTVLAGVALAVAGLVDRAWLRVLLGAAAGGLFMASLTPTRRFLSGGGLLWFWVVLHSGLAVWAMALVAQQRLLLGGARARWAAAVETIAAGWLLAVLAGLAWFAGMTFLLGGSLGGFWGEVAQVVARDRTSGAQTGMRLVSLALAAGAVLLAGRGWPTLRQPAAALAGLVLAVLAYFLPSLGATLLALVVTAITQRWRLAAAAAVAAAWIVGAFYYHLAWPLANKATVLALAGATLAALAWRAQRAASAPAVAAPTRGRGAVWLLAGAAATLVAANFAIWQKETLIAGGNKVYVALAPVDPRSLMQGDYMRLRFALPGAMDEELKQLVTLQRPHVIARRDARGVAQLLRIASPGQPIAADEMRIELTPKGGGWILVTDAWFFREGEAARYELARFGEFRVLPDGRALLVGLTDEQLRRLEP